MSQNRLIYSDSEQSADMLYATGIFVPDPFLWGQSTEESLVIVSPLEVARVRKEAKDRFNVYSFEEAKAKFELENLSPVNQIKGISKLYGINEWQVPANFPLFIAQELADDVSLKAIKNFFPERISKSDEEVKLIREGVELAETGMYRAFEVLAEASISGDQIIWQNEVLTS